MPDPLYPIHPPKQLKVKYDRILEIVKANPRIGFNEIFDLYYGSNPARPIAKRKSLTNIILSLRANHQLTYITGLGCYVISCQSYLPTDISDREVQS